MSHEIVYTSAPEGLKPGARGFCIVVATDGTARNLVERLEGLSGYSHAFLPPDPRAAQNPINYSHLILKVGGQEYHVLSRIADAGLGILSAARIFHLDFIPIAEECYDFVISKDQLDSPMIRRFLSLLQSAAFAERLKQMGGYRLIEPGRRILEQP